ncbi:hypothetical protein [Fusibacter sp. 3D3]|uniref:hypothetical protein n=1 Tax=Fusibacter sp. 3D3 TaxID=1048380 RepID=UPI00085325A3|nr:hypothetical protein [Fusibacter sp. 3D3]GAU75657.1 predicted hydrolase [Fusibacter sp. 3D3]
MNKTSDKDALKQRFNEKFYKFKDMPIAIYGIGEKTEKILELYKNYNFVGIMDKDYNELSYCGFNLLSYDEVVKSIKVVIIAANISSCHIIYQRINFLKESGIRIFYLNGFEPKEIDTDEDPYYKKNEKNILDLIKQHDIICFDIFDTLIMRETLEPSDVFELVEEKLRTEKGLNIDFKKNRVYAEKNVYCKKTTYFNIDMIYDELGELLNLDEQLTREIKNIEFEMEYRISLPRYKMVNLYKYALNAEKRIYLVSDMYWQREKIEILLKKNGIEGYCQLLVSCEEKKSKHDGKIWSVFKKPDHRMLHIGDNLECDVEIPKSYGIETYHIRNSLDIMRFSKYAYLEKKCSSLNQRLLLGKFVSKVFNDPFSLHKGKGTIVLDDMHALGYNFFGPIVLTFVNWLIKTSRTLELNKLLFFARDGYILHEIFELIMMTLNLDYPQAHYFLTSRRAASVAAIEDIEDVALVLREMCKSKNLLIGESVFRTLGIQMRNDDPIRLKFFYEVEMNDLIAHITSEYLNAIEINAKEERQHYKAYIQSIGIGAHEKIGCINFVGRGITQMFVERILGRSMYGFYFSTAPQMKEFLKQTDKIFAQYGKCIDTEITPFHLISNYLLGEVIFSAKEEQLLCFDKNLEPKYINTSKKRNFTAVNECHNGIRQYVLDALNLDLNLGKRQFGIELSDALLGVIVTHKAILSESIRSSLLFSDYYNYKVENIRLEI